MSLRPDITVAAVLERDQRFLIVEERIRNQRVLNQPAGHLEDGESLIEAVVREVREETAWLFEPLALISVYLWRRSDADRSTLRFAFTGRLLSHDAAQQLDQPIIKTHWSTREELAAQQPRLRSPLVLRSIDDYLAGQRLPLTAVQYYTGG